RSRVGPRCSAGSCGRRVGPMQTTKNIAARAGRWSARNRKKALLGWIAFVILAFMAGGNIGTNELTAAESGVGDSGKAAKVVDGAYPDRAEEVVLVQSKAVTSTDPAFRATVHDLTKRLGA